MTDEKRPPDSATTSNPETKESSIPRLRKEQVDENIYKRYGPPDRNIGRDNVYMERESIRGKNTDEALVQQALLNLLPEEARLEDVARAGEGPPDLGLDGRVAIEVTGVQGGGDEFQSDQLIKTLRRKIEALCNAWRKHPTGRGKRLREYTECWIAATIPMPFTWMEVKIGTKAAADHWAELNDEWISQIITAATEGRTLEDPPITQILVLLRNPLPVSAHGLYTYRTKSFRPEVHAVYDCFAQQPCMSMLHRAAVQQRDIRLTWQIGQYKGAQYLVQEAQNVVRDDSPEAQDDRSDDS